MRSIWKYTLGPTAYGQTLEIPEGFRVVHVGPPRATAHTVEGVNMWCEVNAGAAKVPVQFFIVGTGSGIPTGAFYLGTAVMGDGFVWHVYQGKP